MDEARIWLSSMRWDSIPMGGHSRDMAPKAGGPMALPLPPEIQNEEPRACARASGDARQGSRTPGCASPPWDSASSSRELAVMLATKGPGAYVKLQGTAGMELSPSQPPPPSGPPAHCLVL